MRRRRGSLIILIYPAVADDKLIISRLRYEVFQAFFKLFGAVSRRFDICDAYALIRVGELLIVSPRPFVRSYHV